MPGAGRIGPWSLEAPWVLGSRGAGCTEASDEQAPPHPSPGTTPAGRSLCPTPTPKSRQEILLSRGPGRLGVLTTAPLAPPSPLRPRLWQTLLGHSPCPQAPNQKPLMSCWSHRPSPPPPLAIQGRVSGQGEVGVTPESVSQVVWGPSASGLTPCRKETTGHNPGLGGGLPSSPRTPSTPPPHHTHTSLLDLLQCRNPAFRREQGKGNFTSPIKPAK